MLVVTLVEVNLAKIASQLCPWTDFYQMLFEGVYVVEAYITICL